MKRMTVENIDKEIKELSIIKEKLLYFSALECNNINDIILQKYIELQSVKEVADYLNAKEYRIASASGSRKYISNDVSELILSTNLNANKELKEFTKELFNFMRGKTYLARLLKSCN